jgi:predicted Rossmann-fold nucleotide-binding protein
MDAKPPLKRWVLVAGTGLRTGVPLETCWCAEAIGAALADNGFGLVTGGWPGVDFLTAKAFATRTMMSNQSLSQHLIQVFPRSMQRPDYPGGQPIVVNEGFEEFSESIRYANAVVLVGGIGGTYELATLARHEQRPVFAIPATGGDAATVYGEIMTAWNLQHPNALTREDFQSLNAPIGSRTDADRLASIVVRLLEMSLSKSKVMSTNSLFVSYSHDDLVWTEVFKEKLKSVLRPEQLDVWDDGLIQAGDIFELDIGKALAKAKAAVLLLSRTFLASNFITERELPAILRLYSEKELSVLWFKVSDCTVPEELGRFQALYDPETPLSAIRSPASLNIALVEICKRIGSKIL